MNKMTGQLHARLSVENTMKRRMQGIYRHAPVWEAAGPGDTVTVRQF